MAKSYRISGRRDKKLQAYVTPEEYAVVYRLAENSRMSISAIVSKIIGEWIRLKAGALEALAELEKNLNQGESKSGSENESEGETLARLAKPKGEPVRKAIWGSVYV